MAAFYYKFMLQNKNKEWKFKLIILVFLTIVILSNARENVIGPSEFLIWEYFLPFDQVFTTKNSMILLVLNYVRKQMTFTIACFILIIINFFS